MQWSGTHSKWSNAPKQCFIAHVYHSKDVDQIISTYQHQKEDKNNEAENNVIPYVFQMFEDCYTCYGKKNSKEGVNLIF